MSIQLTSNLSKEKRQDFPIAFSSLTSARFASWSQSSKTDRLLCFSPIQAT